MDGGGWSLSVLYSDGTAKESSGNDIYVVNTEADFSHEFNEDDEYTLVLYTANYSTFNQYKKFENA